MKSSFGFILAGVCLLAGISRAAEAPVAISVDANNSGAAIAPDFSGLSFEISQLLPDANGRHYFRADNLPLINLFRALGIRSLRIGGNTSDRDVRRLPGEADLDSLFAFARAAGVKVIYCLRLHNGDAQADAATVKYVMGRYAPFVDCFSIGQEPSAYPVEAKDTRAATERMGAAAEKYPYPAYAAEWKKFAGVIIAAAPDVKFCGPGVHNNADWARRFIADFGHENHVTLITEHLYPGGAGGKVPTPEIGRDRMLGGEFVRACGKLHDGFASMAVSNGLPYRLEEVNNYFNGGATNVSNTFAAALWGLDFMYWWAARGAAGLNFHTGDKVAAGRQLRSSKYTAFFTTTNGFEVRPLGYGIKAFDLGSHGKLVAANISNPENLNLSAYAVRDGEHRLFLTIINKEHGAGARSANVSITPNGGSFAGGQVIYLTAPDGNVAATSGQTLGGAEVKPDGSWNGSWRPLPDARQCFAVQVPAASAAIVKPTGQ